MRPPTRTVRGCGRAALVLCLLLPFGAALRGQSAPFDEYQLKAVFLFNFAQFVEWPASLFTTAETPIVIGVLGEDPFGAALDEVARAEKVTGRALVVRQVSAAGADACHILFISRSEAGRVDQILAALQGRSVLTVSDVEGFAERGGMIGFVTENRRVRLRVNLEAAGAARLTLSSKLLRATRVVRGRKP